MITWLSPGGRLRFKVYGDSFGGKFIMEHFELAQLILDQKRAEGDYYEFLRKDSLSMGLYVLPAGGIDTQHPHTEDEVYYIASGRGMIRIGQEDMPVETGSVVYVDRGVEHHFHGITEDLKILVFFAPPEGSQGDQSTMT
jgi:mannose-6-phosphate isomerase-like protein (cupin superfamily)